MGSIQCEYYNRLWERMSTTCECREMMWNGRYCDEPISTTRVIIFVRWFAAIVTLADTSKCNVYIWYEVCSWLIADVSNDRSRGTVLHGAGINQTNKHNILTWQTSIGAKSASCLLIRDTRKKPTPRLSDYAYETIFDRTQRFRKYCL